MEFYLAAASMIPPSQFQIMRNSAATVSMDVRLRPNCRWYHLTLARLLVVLMAIESLLFLVEWSHLLPKGWPVLIAVTVVTLAVILFVLSVVVSLILRWGFQFSIRSLLVLVIVVAIPFSWLAVEMKRANSQAHMVMEIERLGGLVSDTLVYYSPTHVYRREPQEPEWIRKVFGNAFFEEVLKAEFGGTMLNDRQLASLSEVVGIDSVTYLGLAGTKITDEGLVCLQRWRALQILLLDNTATTDGGLENLKGLGDLSYLAVSNTRVTGNGVQHLKRLIKLWVLTLEHAPVTDAGLQHLTALTQLRSLSLGWNQLTDAGLQQLNAFTQLKSLCLAGPQVTDAWLEHINGLNSLEYLDLAGAGVTNAGLEHLKCLKNLKYVNLGGTKVTRAGDETLRKALPTLQIDR